MPRWTDQVRVSSENGLEGSHEDGYSWRKYGQKDILGTKYPRLLAFSCLKFTIYATENGCMTTSFLKCKPFFHLVPLLRWIWHQSHPKFAAQSWSAALQPISPHRNENKTLFLLNFPSLNFHSQHVNSTIAKFLCVYIYIYIYPPYGNLTRTIILAEAITDAPTEIARTAGLQSKCKDLMKTPPYLMSLTEEHTLVLMANIPFHHQHHQKNKNRNRTLINNCNHKKPSLTFKRAW